MKKGNSVKTLRVVADDARKTAKNPVAEKVGKISIFQKHGAYHLRWWDPAAKRQFSERAGETLEEARAAAHRKLAAVVRPDDVIERMEDPTFGELWVFYKREKDFVLSEGRKRRLDELWKLYFKPKLATVPASRLADAIRSMRDDILNGWTGENRDTVRNDRSKPLSANTIEDIVNIARAVVGVCIENGYVKRIDPIPPIKVPGRTGPRDRDLKGRHVSFSEIGKMIDACEFDHHLAMMLIELGSGVRSGSIIDLTIPQIWWHLDAINMQVPGTPQTAKFRPVVPVSGPLWWVVPKACMSAGHDKRVIHFRSQGLTGKNGTQIIFRIAKRALGDAADGVNWYSFRHTLIDFLELRVPARSLSMLAGHIGALDSRERLSMSRDDGSKMTRLYQRRKLEYLEPIRSALDEEWWPEIQKYCKTDLRLRGGSGSSAWKEAWEKYGSADT